MQARFQHRLYIELHLDVGESFPSILEESCPASVQQSCFRTLLAESRLEQIRRIPVLDQDICTLGTMLTSFRRSLERT